MSRRAYMLLILGGVAVGLLVHMIGLPGQAEKHVPSVAYDGKRVHLFYDVGYFSKASDRKWTQVAIHHAVSPDGVTDWLQDAKPIITRHSFPWAKMEVRSPTALFDGEIIRLWFAGNNWPKDFLGEVQRQGQTKQFGIGYLIHERKGE